MGCVDLYPNTKTDFGILITWNFQFLAKKTYSVFFNVWPNHQWIAISSFLQSSSRWYQFEDDFRVNFLCISWWLRVAVSYKCFIYLSILFHSLHYVWPRKFPTFPRLINAVIFPWKCIWFNALLSGEHPAESHRVGQLQTVTALWCVWW